MCKAFTIEGPAKETREPS